MSERGTGMRADGLGHPILFLKRRRYYIAVMTFIGYVVSYSTRVNLSIAIIYMTKFKNVTRGNTTVEEREFDWNDKTQGLILSSFFYGYIVTQIPGGYLAPIIGGNHVLNLGVAGSGMLSFIGPILIKQGVAAAVVLRVLCGLFQGITYPALNSLLSKWAPPLERTILSTIGISGNFFSSLIIMPICSAIGDNLDWEWMFYVFGLASVVWCLVWFLTVFASPEKDRFIRQSERDYISEAIGNRVQTKPVHPWKKIFSSLPVAAAVISLTGHNWGYYTVLLFGPKYYHETLHYSIKDASFFTGTSFTVVGLIMIVSGYISDTLRSKKYMSTLSVRKLFCGGGFFLQLSFILSLCFIENRECLVVFSILAIGLGGITWAAITVNPLDIAAPHSSIIAGISNTFATLGGALSPIVAALFIDKEDGCPTKKDWIWVWAICAIIYFLSGLFFLIFASGETQKWVHTDPEES